MRRSFGSINTFSQRLTNQQKVQLTGVYYSDSLSSSKKMGGELSSDGKAFVFYTPYAGNHGLLVSDSLIRIVFAVGSSNYTYMSQEAENDVAPFISADNRVMVPLRAIAEALGAKVDWDDVSKTAILSKDGKSAFIAINQALPNDMGTPVIVNSRTMVPLRYIS